MDDHYSKGIGDASKSLFEAPTQLIVLDDSEQDIFEDSEVSVPPELGNQIITIPDSCPSSESQVAAAAKGASERKPEESMVVNLTEASQMTEGQPSPAKRLSEEFQIDKIFTITGLSENSSGDVEPLTVKRKYTDDSGLCGIWKSKRSSDERPPTSRQSDVDYEPPTSLRSAAPISSHILTKARSSPRVAKRSNSCNLECCSSDIPVKSSPRTRRFASADVPTSNSPHQKENITKNDVNVTVRPHKITEEQIKEDTFEDSQYSSSQSAMQGFHLQFSPFGLSQDDSKESEETVTISRLRHMTSSEPVLTTERVESPVCKADQAHSVGYNYSDQSSRNSQLVTTTVMPMRMPPAEGSTDLDSTVSVESPKDYINPLTTKMMSHLSNGFSSTPENVIATLPAQIQQEVSNNTPNFNNQSSDNLLSNAAKGNTLAGISSTTTPSTISPLTNGHSLGLVATHSPSPPIFDLQMGYDDSGDFMSLLIVRTDIDCGIDMSKELQRVSRRFTMDPYFADISKSTSPSSVVGSVPSYNRNSFMSTSSSNSTSSSRTTDGAFIIPQPPKKSISSQGPMTVKGFKALSQRVNEILVHLAEMHGIDLSNISLHQEDKQTSATTTPNNLSVEPLPSDSSAHQNGSATAEEIGHRATPKSSLKKPKAKGRRPMTGKTKRTILPSTSEEDHEYAEGMHSPEMIPSDCATLMLSNSPVYDDIRDLTPLTPKSISRLQGKKIRQRQCSPSPDPRPKTPIQLPRGDSSACSEGTVVLARWVDRRYYSGKVAQILDPNKYLIQFDDGHSKALLDDFIIFGNSRVLPIMGQSVYALVDEDQNFEPGLVLSVEETEDGTVCYRCTTDRDLTVSVAASEMYLTEDQAKSIKESTLQRSPNSTPTTPRRRGTRELDLENIIQGPRSARLREKPSYTPLSKRGKIAVAGSPEASTSGVRRSTPVATDMNVKQRQVSESSEGSGVAGCAGAPEGPRSDPRLEEVAGVEPEVQKTPRKIDGMKAGPLHLKGAARSNPGKSSKIMKCENDDTIALLGPIPPEGSSIFKGICFLLTCTEQPKPKIKIQREYSSSEYDSPSGTDCEDLEFTSATPFMKERIKEQIEAGGGVVYSHFEDVPKKKYSVCKLIAPRPCLTAKYIQCLAVDVKAVTHVWVIRCCSENRILDIHADELPTGWSIERETFVRWRISSDGRRSANPFKDKQILVCSDNETFSMFWERVCSMAGAETRVINEDNLNLSGGHVVVTESDCSHQVQNKAVQDNIPLVSTTWVVQCLIEGRLCSPNGHHKYLFSYTDAD